MSAIVAIVSSTSVLTAVSVVVVGGLDFDSDSDFSVNGLGKRLAKDLIGSTLVTGAVDGLD
jgi:hypothetical protein